MGCVASTADISEPESSPNKNAAGPTKPGKGRTLLTSANSPKGERESHDELPNFKHSRTVNQDVTSPVSPGKSILRSKSFQGLSTKEGSRRATFDTATLDEEERASLFMISCRSGKRRVTLGEAEVREYRVQMTQSRSF
mmetsp:Transcript_118640/g.166794  ORF Transcript_118640/g.166794 Transcript_118640/m.166794 type:complete len:139 (+) Transcript_118640:103-519(+)